MHMGTSKRDVTGSLVAYDLRSLRLLVQGKRKQKTLRIEQKVTESMMVNGAPESCYEVHRNGL